MKITSYIKKFIKNSNESFLELKNNSKKSDDIYSMAILQPLLTDLPYLPFNGGALRPFGMAYVLNEIIINQRRLILEFGSGLSTILMARLIKKNNLQTQIFTFEHNKKWASIIETYLERENLSRIVQVINTDLKKVDTSLGAVKWYDPSVFEKTLANYKFDLVLIDGPPANLKELEYSRLPGLTNIENNLAPDFCIILDDINRKGEQEVAKNYHALNQELTFTTVSQTIGVFRTKNDFNPIPIHY
ncbi:putative O-methyltransferase [Aequorivita sublithincola DSM 14238]|uniref:Putative O-methyltransferase n=1 Tax=Aequorivita sublithincola (strain DSM 14238 / LMG 21431 / ACAM 643 / 9-3) TaxID=746697 RepID=I3YXH2_AEQSU|nr:class I SAM-dependent methyltransferase [Aequorivita sublithincola]AFL81690.1 putative O-methyltransferase [Aequorivita sublithincola DSM 14238]